MMALGFLTTLYSLFWAIGLTPYLCMQPCATGPESVRLKYRKALAFDARASSSLIIFLNLSSDEYEEC